MPRFAGHLSLGLLLTVVVACSARGDSAGGDANFDGTLTVQVASGRVFSGLLDPESDDTQLRLQSVFGEGVIIRPIDWDRVVEVEIAGWTCSGVQLREALRNVQAAALQGRPALVANRRSYGVSAPVAETAAVPPARTTAERRVVSLAIDADTARWDANVEIDGLAVRVMPLDGFGTMTPVEGTLEVELIAEPVGYGGPGGIELPDVPPHRIGRWQEAVHVTDFDRPSGQDGVRNGALYLLRYQEPNPEFDRRFGSHVAIHARLSVPGQGVFEATQDGVRIRPFSPIRDRLEATTGHRYFPQERTGDGRL